MRTSIFAFLVSACTLLSAASPAPAQAAEKALGSNTNSATPTNSSTSDISLDGPGQIKLVCDERIEYRYVWRYNLCTGTYYRVLTQQLVKYNCRYVRVFWSETHNSWGYRDACGRFIPVIWPGR